MTPMLPAPDSRHQSLLTEHTSTAEQQLHMEDSDQQPLGRIPERSHSPQFPPEHFELQADGEVMEAAGKKGAGENGGSTGKEGGRELLDLPSYGGLLIHRTNEEEGLIVGGATAVREQSQQQIGFVSTEWTSLQSKPTGAAVDASPSNVSEPCVSETARAPSGGTSGPGTDTTDCGTSAFVSEVIISSSIHNSSEPTVEEEKEEVKGDRRIPSAHMDGPLSGSAAGFYEEESVLPPYKVFQVGVRGEEEEEEKEEVQAFPCLPPEPVRKKQATI